MASRTERLQKEIEEAEQRGLGRSGQRRIERLRRELQQSIDFDNRELKVFGAKSRTIGAPTHEAVDVGRRGIIARNLKTGEISEETTARPGVKFTRESQRFIAQRQIAQGRGKPSVEAVDTYREVFRKGDIRSRSSQRIQITQQGPQQVQVSPQRVEVDVRKDRLTRATDFLENRYPSRVLKQIDRIQGTDFEQRRTSIIYNQQQLQKAQEAFNAKYGGRELEQEEYDRAIREQQIIDENEQRINRFREQLQSDVEAQPLPQKTLRAFSQGTLTAIPRFIGATAGLLVRGGKGELTEGDKEFLSLAIGGQQSLTKEKLQRQGQTYLEFGKDPIPTSARLSAEVLTIASAHTVGSGTVQAAKRFATEPYRVYPEASTVKPKIGSKTEIVTYTVDGVPTGVQRAQFNIRGRKPATKAFVQSRSDVFMEAVNPTPAGFRKRGRNLEFGRPEQLEVVSKSFLVKNGKQIQPAITASQSKRAYRSRINIDAVTGGASTSVSGVNFRRLPKTTQSQILAMAERKAGVPVNIDQAAGILGKHTELNLGSLEARRIVSLPARGRTPKRFPQPGKTTTKADFSGTIQEVAKDKGPIRHVDDTLYNEYYAVSSPYGRRATTIHGVIRERQAPSPFIQATDVRFIQGRRPVRSPQQIAQIAKQNLIEIQKVKAASIPKSFAKQPRSSTILKQARASAKLIELERIKALPSIVGGGGKSRGYFAGLGRYELAVPTYSSGVGTALINQAKSSDFALNRSSFGLITREIQAQPPKQPDPEPEPTKEKIRTKTRSSGRLVPREVAREVVREEARLTPRLRSLRGPPRTPREPFTFLSPRGDKRLLGKKGGSDTGYHAFVLKESTKKGKARYQRVSKKPLTRAQALDLGSYITDNSVGARFKIQRTRSVASPLNDIRIANYFNRSKDKFREFRVKRGKRVGTPNIFIEKRNRRIDTLGERQELSIARAARMIA